MSALSEALDFDHVVTIDAMGTLSDATVNAPYAPECYNPDSRSIIAPDGWALITGGLTGQHGYNGPWLHDSEMIEGGVEEHVYAHAREHGGGYYVAVYGQFPCTDDTHPTYADLSADENRAAREGSHDDCETQIEGWAVAYRRFES